MLTAKQKNIYDYINKRIEKIGIAPSHKEIAQHFKLSSVATVHEHLQALQKKGYLQKERGQARAMTPSRQLKTTSIPLLGPIAAGQPIEAIETTDEYIDVPIDHTTRSENLYALRVQGNSMVDEGIFDGDIVVIRKQATADNGQTVVAIIDENEATLKKIFKEKGRFRLQPANQTMMPFYRKEVEIRGIVIKIIRTLETNALQTSNPENSNFLRVEEARCALEKRYKDKLRVNPELNRMLVSFQGNKKQPGYRWYKFKEGYSSALVSYYLDYLSVRRGKVLDPFAGSGTSLFTVAEHNLSATGIELLPVCREIMEARKIALDSKNHKQILEIIGLWISKRPWNKEGRPGRLPHLKITLDAFSENTEQKIYIYLDALKRLGQVEQKILRFALMCVLEEVSFTRKDGQYLRWDYRSKRSTGGKQFDKGVIKEFDQAITAKLEEIYADLQMISAEKRPNSMEKINIISGSCLDEVPQLRKDQFELIITSPPYCNRYDYTRTYALELMTLGIDEEQIRALRQTMLTCTVENREKKDLMTKFSKKIYASAHQTYHSQVCLKHILAYLDSLRDKGKLNNPGLVRMVKNYFYEMCLLIFALSDLMKKDAYFVMVNDNVRYAGIEIPVDLILSEFAIAAGLRVKEIQVLPRGKGNSSQQMGKHGRTEIRKCVYIWQKL